MDEDAASTGIAVGPSALAHQVDAGRAILPHPARGVAAYEEESDIGGVCDRAGNLLLQAIVKPGIDSDCRSSVLESIKALTSSELCDYNYCNFDNLLQQLTMLTLQGDDAIKFVDKMIASHAGKY